jgi:hypothetical protein
VASADIGGIISIFLSSRAAFSVASGLIFAALTRARSSSISLLNSSFLPSSFWIAFICSTR